MTDEPDTDSAVFPDTADINEDRDQVVNVIYADQFTHVIIETCRSTRSLTDIVLLATLHFDLDLSREDIADRVADLRDNGLLIADDDGMLSPTEDGREYATWLAECKDLPSCRDPTIVYDDEG